jgi:hypothetical protein
LQPSLEDHEAEMTEKFIDLTQAEFSVKHGRNTTDRMVPDLLQALADLINKSKIVYNGKECELKQLGDTVVSDAGEDMLVFDVKNPDDTFDHVEFKVVKSGWGRKL